MDTKHTAGPWTVDGDTVKGPRGNVVAECCGYSVQATDPTQIAQGGREANARLIAAAPAMYDALLGLFAECCMTHKTWGDGSNRQAAYEAMKAANDAIALAEGREVTA